MCSYYTKYLLKYMQDCCNILYIVKVYILWNVVMNMLNYSEMWAFIKLLVL